MTTSLWFIIPMAIILGFLSGLGTGGGSLLILWLTLGVNMDYPTAKAINLLFFLPAAVIACLFRRKQHNLPFRKIAPAIIAGCISAGVVSIIGTELELDVLKKMFGIVLLFTGFRELFYRPRKAR